jgi:hypothetical protein
MKYEYFGPLGKLRAIHLDAKSASSALWVARRCISWKAKKVIETKKVEGRWLPQEIIDHIVDYISDDRAALFTCTYLSRAWCITARAHLHRTLVVSNPLWFGAVDDLLKMGMAHLVREMVVTRKIGETEFWLPATVTRLDAFTHLQELDIKFFDVGAPLLWLHEHCEILKSTVRSLTLRYPKGSIKQLVYLISLFSNLENLTVDGFNKAVAHDSQVPVVQGSPPLTGRLVLGRIIDQEFFSALASIPGGVRFRTVDLQLCEGVQGIIDACAMTMERLICRPRASDQSGFKELDLSECDFLRHVEVNFPSISRAFPDYPFYDFVSAIPSPKLETCLLRSYDDDLEELKQLLWTTFKPENTSVAGKELDTQSKRDVKITFCLDIEMEEADDNRKSTEEALRHAAANGMFDFLTSPPTLEVYARA